MPLRLHHEEYACGGPNNLIGKSGQWFLEITLTLKMYTLDCKFGIPVSLYYFVSRRSSVEDSLDTVDQNQNRKLSGCTGAIARPM